MNQLLTYTASQALETSLLRHANQDIEYSLESSADLFVGTTSASLLLSDTDGRGVQNTRPSRCPLCPWEGYLAAFSVFVHSDRRIRSVTIHEDSRSDIDYVVEDNGYCVQTVEAGKRTVKWDMRHRAVVWKVKALYREGLGSGSRCDQDIHYGDLLSEGKSVYDHLSRFDMVSEEEASSGSRHSDSPAWCLANLWHKVKQVLVRG